MIMKPGLREMIWGGSKIKSILGKQIPSDKTGESWELSARADISSVITNGEYAGERFYDIFLKYPQEICGKCGGAFPWLVKFIDASDVLSVQVHPDDEISRRFGDDGGKTEMWYVVQADEGAELTIGVKEALCAQELEACAKNGSLADKLNKICVKEGDSFFIPAGRIHAIGAGCLILEIQQNSDTTYRLYDWQRTGADGKPRELHLEKAVYSSCLEPCMPSPDKTPVLENGDILISQCEFFKVVKRKPCGKSSVGGMSLVVNIGDASVTVGGETLGKYCCAFVPHACRSAEIEGGGEVIILSY